MSCSHVRGSGIWLALSRSYKSTKPLFVAAASPPHRRTTGNASISFSLTMGYGCTEIHSTNRTATSMVVTLQDSCCTPVQGQQFQNLDQKCGSTVAFMVRRKRLVCIIELGEKSDPRENTSNVGAPEKDLDRMISRRWQSWRQDTDGCWCMPRGEICANLNSCRLEEDHYWKCSNMGNSYQQHLVHYFCPARCVTTTDSCTATRKSLAKTQAEDLLDIARVCNASGARDTTYRDRVRRVLSSVILHHLVPSFHVLASLASLCVRYGSRHQPVEGNIGCSQRVGLD